MELNRAARVGSYEAILRWFRTLVSPLVAETVAHVLAASCSGLACSSSLGRVESQVVVFTRLWRAEDAVPVL